MIEIEKAEKYRCCNVCYSEQDVYNVIFRSVGQGTQVALCKKCLHELVKHIQVDVEETFGWCACGENPCKEYDMEHHCCHRWTKVISETVAELKEKYPTKKGKWQRRNGSDCWECSECHAVLESNDFCSHNFYYCYHCGADMTDEDGCMYIEKREE